jgi:hypothetical protein
MNAISIVQVSEQELSLEWSSSGSNDMIADSALALLSGMDSNFATAKRELNKRTFDEVLKKADRLGYSSVTSRPHGHAHDHDHEHKLDTAAPEGIPEAFSSTSASRLTSDIHRLRLFLLAHFGDVSVPLMQEKEGMEDELLVIRVDVDGVVARIDLMTMVSTIYPSQLRKLPADYPDTFLLATFRSLGQSLLAFLLTTGCNMRERHAPTSRCWRARDGAEYRDELGQRVRWSRDRRQGSAAGQAWGEPERDRVWGSSFSWGWGGCVERVLLGVCFRMRTRRLGDRETDETVVEITK